MFPDHLRPVAQFDEPEQAILTYALDRSREMTRSEVGYIYFLNADETEMTLRAWSAETDGGRTPPDSCRVSAAQLTGGPVRQRGPIIINPAPGRMGRTDYADMPIPITRHLGVPIIDNGRVVLVAGLANRDEDYTQADMGHFSLPMEYVWRIIQRKRMESDLINAMKSSDRASKSKSQFLANMSHELRTPLNGIMGMTQLLLGTDVTSEQKEYLTLSMEAALHLSKVMTSLLDLSSIEAGAITVTPVNFNLPDTLESLIKPLALQAGAKSVDLRHEIARTCPPWSTGTRRSCARFSST